MHFLRRELGFPTPLNQALLNFFWEGKSPERGDLKSLSKALERLWPTLAVDRGQRVTGDRKKHQSHYSMDQQLARAYAAYYLPANAMKVPLILEEMRLSGLTLEGEVSWLDAGAGPGTALWGAQWWASHRGVRLDFTALEQSRAFLEIAPELFRSLMAVMPQEAVDHSCPKPRFEQFRHEPSSRILESWIRKTRPRVLSMMNSIGEMSPDSGSRKEWISGIVDELSTIAQDESVPRWLLLVEPGSKAASRELLEVRETLRLRQLERGDVRIWLPCLSARPCGALAKHGDWCHEEVSCEFPEWLNQLGAEAGLRKEALLFSYLVVSIGVHPETPLGWPERGQRVVSQLMREKGLVQCFMCTSDGKQKARVLNSRKSEANQPVAEAIRGELFDVVETDEKGNVVSATPVKMAVEADPTVFPKP